MITVYCDMRSRECREIDDSLKEMVVDHRIVSMSDPSASRIMGCSGMMPAMVDGDSIFCGMGPIRRHIEEIGCHAKLWRKYQSDACYCDEQGSVE